MSVFSCLELFWALALNYLPAYQHHQHPALSQFHMEPIDESDITSHMVTLGQNLGVIFHITFSLPYRTSYQLQILRHCLETPFYSLSPSVLPLSLPNSDQIHHCFPGHLKQPLNSSSCPHLYLHLSTTTVHPMAQLFFKNGLILPLPPVPKEKDQRGSDMLCQPQ